MSGEFTVSDNMLESLRATRPWVKFLAILGFIGCGFMVLVSLILFAGFGAKQEGAMAGFGPMLGAFYLLFVLFYFFPCLYLLRYAGAISRIQAEGQSAMEDALAKQKSFWKFIGMMAAIILALELLVLVGGIVFGIIGAAARH